MDYRNSRYCASGSGRLRLSAHRKINRGQNFRTSSKKSLQNQGSSSSQQETTPPPAIKTEPPTDDEPVSNPISVPESSSTQYVIKGKRFVNVGYLIRSLQKLNDHGGYDCNFSDMTICGETKEGWNIGVELSCKRCFTSVVVWMEDPDAKLVKTRPNLLQTATIPQTQPQMSTIPRTQSQISPAKVPLKKSKPHPRKTPTPPPDNSVRHFLVPLPLTRSVNLPLINTPQATPFIKQEVLRVPSTSHDTSSSMSNVPPSSSTKPAAVQLLFFVDQPASSQPVPTRFASTAKSSVENITVTPDIFVGSQKYSSTSLGTSSTSENITVTPDIYPADVLPVDLNLVKKEVEDEGESLGDGHQSMGVNDKPGVCLVPMSETSLDPSQKLFASDDPKLPTTTTEIPEASSSARGIKISSVTSCSKTSATRIRSETSTTLSETADSSVPTENSAATSRWTCPKYNKLITNENAHSLIWKYFGLPADENGRVVDSSITVCRICRKCLKYSTVGRGTTTKMVHHLKLCHPLKYKDMSKRSKQFSLDTRKDTADDPKRSSSIENMHGAKKTLEDTILPTFKLRKYLSNFRKKRCQKTKYSQLIKNIKAKSIIWKHFRLPADENGFRVSNSFSVCEICKNRVASKGGTTSNMFGHLKVHHPLQYKVMIKESKSKTRSSKKNEVSSPKRSTSIEDIQIMKEPLKNAISPNQNTTTVLSTRPLDSESQLLSNKMHKSIIWKYFKLSTDDSKIVICNICTHQVLYIENTAYMFKHLKLRHPTTYKSSLYEGSKSDIPTTYSLNKNDLSVLNRLSPIKIPRDTKEESPRDAKTPVLQDICLLNYQPLHSDNCIESIAKFLAFSLLPYSLVEMKSFIHMIRNLNPSYKIPSKKYFSKTGIPKLYNKALEKLKQEISIVKGKEISMTMDYWTSVTNTPYIAVTIHFIDHQWNLKSACLNCISFEVDHTNSNVCNTLTVALSNWGLDVTNVTCCTADNGSNILKAMSHLQLPHISCFGHNLNIGINRALAISCLEKSVSKLNQLKSAISQSWKMKRDLAKAQESLQMEIVGLPSVCSTSWRSTLKLIRRFLSNQLPISKILEDYPDQKHLMPETSEVSALEDFITSTKLLEDVTTTLSGEEYISASSIWPLYRKIKKNLQCQDSENELSKQIKSEILSALSQRYDEESQKTILWMSSLCDPRFRLNFTDNAHDIKAIALQEMTRVYKTIDTLPASQPGTQKKGLEKLFEFEDSSSDNDSLPGNKAQAELNKYLSMPKVNLNASPFKWWKSHEDSFPVLKTLARKYLAIQGSSVPSDRVFSTKIDVITRQRAALLPKHAEMQIFLAENKKCF